VGAALRRSSYAVLGVIGLIAASAHYAGEESVGDVLSGHPPTKWALPVAFLCRGGFLLLLGLLLRAGRGDTAPQPAENPAAHEGATGPRAGLSPPRRRTAAGQPIFFPPDRGRGPDGRRSA